MSELALSDYERMSIAHALRELASRRYEQAMDRQQEFLRDEADSLVELANKINISAHE